MIKHFAALVMVIFCVASGEHVEAFEPTHNNHRVHARRS